MVEFLLVYGANSAAEGVEGERPLDVVDGAQKAAVRERLSQALTPLGADPVDRVEVPLHHEAGGSSR